MGKTEVRMGNFKDIPPKAGLKDGGHVILACSACGKPLVDIWIIKADAINPNTGKVLEWKMVALCCYCGDRSFQETVHGRYALGCIGKDIPSEEPDGSDDSKLETSINRIETKEGVLIFHTVNRNSNANKA